MQLATKGMVLTQLRPRQGMENREFWSRMGYKLGEKLPVDKNFFYPGLYIKKLK